MLIAKKIAAWMRKKRQSSDNNTKMNHILALSDKVSKATIIKIEAVKRSQIDIIELKCKKKKSSISGLNVWLVTAEDKTSEFKDRTDYYNLPNLEFISTVKRTGNQKVEKIAQGFETITNINLCCQSLGRREERNIWKKSVSCYQQFMYIRKSASVSKKWTVKPTKYF